MSQQLAIGPDAVGSETHRDRSGALLLLVSPFFVFGSSASEAASLAARALMVLTLLALWWRRDRYASSSWGVTLCIGGIIVVGLRGAELSSLSTWTSVIQLMLLHAVTVRQKVVWLDDPLRRRLLRAAAAFLMLGLVLTVAGPSGVEYDAFIMGPFGNPNALGLAGAAVGILGFLLGAGERPSPFRLGFRLAAAAAFVTVVLSGSRTAMGATVVFLLTYAVGKSVSRAATRAIVLAALVAVPAVIVGYGTWLAESDIAQAEVGDKQLLSGRNLIWPIVLALAAEEPVVGHGLGRTPSEYLPDEVSSHNGYLQILYQVGAIGLAFYIGIFIALFRRALAMDDARARAASIGVLCAAMLCELFEVLLTQNHFGIGLLFWVLATTTIVRPGSSVASGQEITESAAPGTPSGA